MSSFWMVWARPWATSRSPIARAAARPGPSGIPESSARTLGASRVSEPSSLSKSTDVISSKPMATRVGLLRHPRRHRLRRDHVQVDVDNEDGSNFLKLQASGRTLSGIPDGPGRAAASSAIGQRLVAHGRARATPERRHPNPPPPRRGRLAELTEIDLGCAWLRGNDGRLPILTRKTRTAGATTPSARSGLPRSRGDGSGAAQGKCLTQLEGQDDPQADSNVGLTPRDCQPND